MRKLLAFLLVFAFVLGVGVEISEAASRPVLRAAECNVAVGNQAKNLGLDTDGVIINAVEPRGLADLVCADYVDAGNYAYRNNLTVEGKQHNGMGSLIKRGVSRIMKEAMNDIEIKGLDD